MKISEALSAIGVLAGVASLVSFIQLSFNIDVLSVFGEFLKYYRVLVNHTLGLPAKLLGLDMPQRLLDFWTLSFVGAGAYCRVPNIDESRALRDSSFTDVPYWRIILFTIMGLFGFGLVIFLWAISPTTYVDGFWEERLDLSRAAIRNAVIIILGAIVFYLLNAFFPYSWSA